MFETEEAEPYKYRGTFNPKPKTVQVAEVDKEALQGYINRLLGVKEPKGSTGDSTSNKD
jgi:hypothetical protein